MKGTETRYPWPANLRLTAAGEEFFPQYKFSFGLGHKLIMEFIESAFPFMNLLNSWNLSYHWKLVWHR